MEYMESLTDKPQAQLLDELRGRVFYNPLAKRFEIADRFIAGNVVAKAEYIGEYLQTHPDDAESRVSLEALRKAAPVPIPFEELDFNCRVQPLCLMAVRHRRVRPLQRQRGRVQYPCLRTQPAYL